MSVDISEFKKDKSHPVARERLAAPLDDLLEDIAERQEELFKTQRRLYDEARRASSLTKYMRIAVIFLGAFAATREVADRLFVHPESSEAIKVVVVVIYTTMALAITVIGSISAALGLAEKASGLGVLAAECNDHMLKVDCERPREGESSDKRQIGQARRLINYQNEKISSIQGRSAKLGVLVLGVKLNSAEAAPRAARR